MDRDEDVMAAVVVMKNGWDWIEEVEVPWSNDGRERGDFKAALTPRGGRACLPPWQV
jgi:hypothetical protein